MAGGNQMCQPQRCIGNNSDGLHHSAEDRGPRSHAAGKLREELGVVKKKRPMIRLLSVTGQGFLVKHNIT